MEIIGKVRIFAYLAVDIVVDVRKSIWEVNILKNV